MAGQVVSPGGLSTSRKRRSLRGGFTFVEMLLAGAILATISFGALVGTLQLSKFADEQAEALIADGYCWDVIWKLFNQDLSDGKGTGALDLSAFVEPGQPPALTMNFEVEENALPGLYRDGYAKPMCYVTLSNAVNSAREVDTSGVFLAVNLEWGPAGARSALVARGGTAQGPAPVRVFNHPIRVFRSFVPRSAKAAMAEAEAAQ